MARPKKIIDRDQLIKLAERQWSVKQIASFFNVSHDIITRRFASDIEKARQTGTAKLLDLLWARIAKGDAKADRVLIHMAKHYLGHHDKVDIEANVKSGFLKVDKVENGVVIGSRELHKVEK